MEKFKQADKDITLKVEIEGGMVNTTLVNFYLPESGVDPDLKMDEKFMRKMEPGMENKTDEELKKYFWENSVFNTAEQFRSQAQSSEDKDIAEVFSAVAEAVERMDMNQVKLQVIRK